MKRYIDTGIHTTLFLDFEGFCALLNTDAGTYAAGCWEYWAKYCCGISNSNMFLVDDLKDVDYDRLQIQFDLPSMNPAEVNESYDQLSWMRVKDEGLLLIRRANNDNGTGDGRKAADVDLIAEMFMAYVEEVALIFLRDRLTSRVALMMPEYPHSADVHYTLRTATVQQNDAE